MSQTKRNILIFFVMVVVLIAGVAWYVLRGDTAKLTIEQLSGQDPQITAPREESFPTIEIAEIVGWQDGETPVAAQGLKVERFAEELDHPRTMLVLDNGDILVAETNSPPRENKGIEGWIMRNLMDRAGAGSASANRISLIRDNDGDGFAEFRKTLVEGLNSPFGMVVLGEKLYVANTDAVVAFPFTPGTEEITAAPEKILDLNAKKPNNHWTRNLAVSPDEKTLYVSVGSNSNIGENGLDKENQRAAILAVDIETQEWRVFSTGLRNPVGLDFNPDSDMLWTVVNERDMLGSDMVPDYLTRVPFGSQFGWPWIYWGDYEDLRVEPRRRDLIEYTRRPDYALGAHVAPLGLVFAQNAKLGGKYARGAFVGRHGSWNRQPLSGYDVVFVAFDERGNTLDAPPVPVLGGFLTEDGNARGRPAMVAIDATGALLVSDDASGMIWRVTATN